MSFDLWRMLSYYKLTIHNFIETSTKKNPAWFHKSDLLFFSDESSNQ